MFTLLFLGLYIVVSLAKIQPYSSLVIGRYLGRLQGVKEKLQAVSIFAAAIEEIFPCNEGCVRHG